MMKSKKAIVFIFISIVIAGLLTTIYATYQVTPLDHNVKFDEIRVKAMNDYLETLIDYSKTSLRVSGYQTLRGMVEFIYQNDSFFLHEPDIKASFVECILNGSLRDNDVDCPYMENRTIIDMMANAVSLSEEFGYNETSITINSLSIDQTKPFALTATMDISIHLKNQDINWDVDKTIITDISITGIKDPLYYDLPYNNTFLESDGIQGDFEYEDFTTFANESAYIVSQTGLNFQFNIYGASFKPRSFFGRLANSTTVKAYPELTIISVLTPEKLEDAGIAIEDQLLNKSYVDFLYHKEFRDCEIMRTVINDSTETRIDRYHATQTFGFPAEELNQVMCN